MHARSIARMEFAKHLPEQGPTANALRDGHAPTSGNDNLSSGDMGVAR